jgi:hypothetical protein
MKQSNFLSLNWLDLGKGVIVAVIVFLLNFAQETWVPSLNVSPEIKLFIITGIGYLLKNFFTPKPNAFVSEIGLPLPKDPKK